MSGEPDYNVHPGSGRSNPEQNNENGYGTGNSYTTKNPYRIVHEKRKREMKRECQGGVWIAGWPI